MTRASAQQDPREPEVRQSDGITLDEQLLEVAKQDPAFGGMFFDNDGRLTMYVLKSTSPRRTATAGSQACRWASRPRSVAIT